MANPPGGATRGFEWYQPGSGGQFGGAVMRILAPPGTTTLHAANSVQDDFGSYTLSTRSASVDGCFPITRTTFGVSTNIFALNNSDCFYTPSVGPQNRADRFTIFVPGGKTLSVTVSANIGNFLPLIDLRDGFNDGVQTGTLYASSLQTSGSSASVSSTTSGDRWVQIWVITRDGPVGGYTITIAP